MLTERQAEVLRIIRKHVATYGFAPTLHELCEYTGTKSAGAMTKHIAALERNGFLTRTNGARQIMLSTHCPCCSQAFARRSTP